MKYLPLIWAGLWRKPWRTVLTFVAIANGFLLFGILQKFELGLGQARSDAHADILVTTSAISQFEPLPVAYARQIAAIPGVLAVTPSVSFQGVYRDGAQAVHAYAVDAAQIPQTMPAIRMPAAQLEAMRNTRSGAIISEELTRTFGWRVGDVVPLNSRTWTNRDGTRTWRLKIVGVFVAHGSLLLANALLMNYDYLDQARTTAPGTTSGFIVRLADSGKADLIAAAIDRTFVNSPNETKTASERQFALDAVRQIGDIGFLVGAIVSATFFALLLSVGAVMMQSTRERASEFATLKALGFSNIRVLTLIASEAMLFCVVSACTGLALSLALFPVVIHAMGLISISGGNAMIYEGVALAVLLALASGLPPAWMVTRQPITEALVK